MLADLYLKIKQGLIMQEQGGAVARVQEVKVLKASRRRAKSKNGFAERVTWQVEGTVEHWGHIHTRVNEYSADLEIEPAGGSVENHGHERFPAKPGEKRGHLAKTMIAISDLEFRFPRFRFPSGRSVAPIARAERVAIVGPSGRAKPRCLHLISGILSPGAGTIRVRDREMHALGDAARRAFRVAQSDWSFRISNSSAT